jgi:hypothetical protein
MPTELQKAWAARVLSLALDEAQGTAASETVTNASGRSEYASALADWEFARAKAVRQLQNLAAAIKASGHSKADNAVIQVLAVVKNLTPQPKTSAELRELEEYLYNDEIANAVERPNGFGVKVRFRLSLLSAIDEIAASLGP